MLIEKRGFFTNILTVLPNLESTSSPFSALHQLERKIILAACIPDRVTEGGGGFSTARIFPSGTSKCVGDKRVKLHQHSKWTKVSVSSCFAPDKSEELSSPNMIKAVNPEPKLMTGKTQKMNYFMHKTVMVLFSKFSL